MRPQRTAVLALLVAPALATAQEPHLGLFLYEKSYAGAGTPDVIGAPGYYAGVAEPDLLAEAQLAVHLELRRGLNEQELREGLGGSGLNVYLTPQFRLRGLDVPSGPVRSPSFMPKFTFQYLKSTGGDPLDPTSGPRWVLGLQGVIGHHSNGGEACEFTDEDFDNDCTFIGGGQPPPPEAREFMVRGGNFSTNYVELGGNVRRGRISDDPVPHWTWAVEAGVAGQIHHDVIGFPLPGGAKGDFAALYGKHRLRLDVGAHRVLLDALAVRAWARTDLFDPPAERFAGARGYTLESELFLQKVEGLRSLPPLVDLIPTFLGIGVRYARGQDYYNTQFVRDISHLQLFVVVEAWSPHA